MAEQSLAQRIARILYDKKALEIKALQVEHMTVITEAMVMASGRNAIQVRALADEVEEMLGMEGIALCKKEGQTSARWVILDYGAVLVHIFQPEDRSFYRLERLWDDGCNMIPLPFAVDDENTPFMS
jgi:ribosome-associated protein